MRIITDKKQREIDKEIIDKIYKALKIGQGAKFQLLKMYTGTETTSSTDKLLDLAEDIYFTDEIIIG